MLMEQFNSKLYEKYTKLKRRKFSEIEERNQKTVSAELQYRSATEELIEYLKNENDKLRVEILSMKDQYRECQKLLLEENQKSRISSIEFGAPKEPLVQNNDNADESLHSSACRSPAITSKNLGERFPAKKKLFSRQDAILSEKDASLTSNECYNQNRLIPDCCKRTKDHSGDGISKKCSSCAFHMLVELLVGMNFVVDYQTEGPRFSVFHQMSGYNFTLNWERDRDGGEGKLAYQVSSLGTIERIALDWMKEDIVFNVAMLPIFFDRLSRVVGKK